MTQPVLYSSVSKSPVQPSMSLSARTSGGVACWLFCSIWSMTLAMAERGQRAREAPAPALVTTRASADPEPRQGREWQQQQQQQQQQQGQGREWQQQVMPSPAALPGDSSQPSSEARPLHLFCQNEQKNISSDLKHTFKHKVIEFKQAS